MASTSRLIAFYEGHGQDFKGRSLEELLSWSDKDLESHHDFIQVLFPLPEGSMATDSAPIVTKEIFEAFRSSPELRANVRRTFVRLLKFWGFQLKMENGKVEVVFSDNYRDAFNNWVGYSDHNHLRISRCLRSLRVLGLEDEARAFKVALDKVSEGGVIGNRSMLYWTRAADRALHIPPDIDEDDELGYKGKSFLM